VGKNGTEQKRESWLVFENVFTSVQKCIITDMNLFFQFADFIAKEIHEGGTVQAPREL
jgi:hypothetical protein